MNWRMFRRIYSGLLKYKKLNKKCIFITFTSNVYEWNDVDSIDDRRKLQVIRKRFELIRRRYAEDFGYDFGEYFRVACFTKEGLPHLHVVCCNDFIDHSWLSSNWCDLHGAFVVDVRSMDENCYDSAKYVISQYVSDQNGLTIYGYSRNWIYRGFVDDLKSLKKKCRSSDFKVHKESNKIYLPIRYEMLNESIEKFIDFKYEYDLGVDYFIDFNINELDFFRGFYNEESIL